MSYDLKGYTWHQHSNKLMEAILELWPEKDHKYIDIGCGHNFYIQCLYLHGYANTMGFDRFCVESEVCTWVEDMQELAAQVKYSIPHKARVLCLEVGEHIAPEESAQFLDIIASCGDVLMSWAVPGQEGHGHVNCQPNEVIIAEMEARGKVFDPEITQRLRDAVVGCHCTWFVNTLMYFRDGAS